MKMGVCPYCRRSTKLDENGIVLPHNMMNEETMPQCVGSYSKPETTLEINTITIWMMDRLRMIGYHFIVSISDPFSEEHGNKLRFRSKWLRNNHNDMFVRIPFYDIYAKYCV